MGLGWRPSHWEAAKKCSVLLVVVAKHLNVTTLGYKRCDVCEKLIRIDEVYKYVLQGWPRHSDHKTKDHKAFAYLHLHWRA